MEFQGLRRPTPAPKIEAETLARQLRGRQPPLVVDVRSPLEFRWGHVPGAISVPLPALARRVDELGQDPPRAIVCVSLKGPRGSTAARLLRRRGLDARHLHKGMRAWWAEDLPTLEGSPGPGRPVVGEPLSAGPVGQLSSPADYRHALEALLGIPATDGNAVDSLRNGTRAFPAMLDAVSSARESVDLLTYVYWTGDVARRMAGALAERARTGVRVRVLLDALGAYRMDPSLIGEMRTAGARVDYFRRPWRPRDANHRTHRKVLVCDATVGFTGGMGIAAEWQGDARDPSEWRDTHFRIRGPAVNGLRAAFFENWVEAGNTLAEETERFPPQTPVGESAIQVVRSQPAAAGLSEGELVMRALVRVARQRLRFSTAYFTPDGPFLRLLRDAVERGVEVEVLIPGRHADKRMVQLAEHHDYGPLLDAGVRIANYQRTMLHTKIVTVDGVVACIGSANVNSRSLRKDDEVCLVVHDVDVVGTLDRHFDEDRCFAERIDPARWRRRGWLPRVKERAADVLDPHV
ncbi:MAG: phospholipase D-like domain-containing protein [Actinomycetota bacterium]|nr:phospholipase D-like domain-containing protein [Actinomycetota bacterium]